MDDDWAESLMAAIERKEKRQAFECLPENKQQQILHAREYAKYRRQRIKSGKWRTNRRGPSRVVDSVYVGN